MKTLHIVTHLIGGFAREDNPTVSVIGAFTNPDMANLLKRVAGASATVTQIEVDHVPPGLMQAIKEMGLTPPLTPQETCTHQKWIYPTEQVRNDFSGEWETPEPYEVSTYEDVDVGRFRCTKCNHVGYYTSLWRDYFEKGIPCPGSEGVKRELPPLPR